MSRRERDEVRFGRLAAVAATACSPSVEPPRGVSPASPLRPTGAVRVLIACEFSGIVRDAFTARGHNAWSCDLLPSERPGQHILGDVLHLLARDPWWDLVIAHPPCTYLANSGAKHLYRGMKKVNGHDPDRWARMRDAAEFFRTFLALACPVAIENPIMHCHARELVGGGPSQIIQPWQFGHGETKATCLWLKGLPPLRPTDIVEGREQRVFRMPPAENRGKERSRTFEGIAAAMAEQWGDRLEAERLVA